MQSVLTEWVQTQTTTLEGSYDIQSSFAWCFAAWRLSSSLRVSARYPCTRSPHRKARLPAPSWIPPGPSFRTLQSTRQIRHRIHVDLEIRQQRLLQSSAARARHLYSRIAARTSPATAPTASLVVVGQVTSLEPRLAVASSATEVVVTEQAPVMNLESPDFSSTLESEGDAKYSHQQPPLVSSGHDHARRRLGHQRLSDWSASAASARSSTTSRSTAPTTTRPITLKSAGAPVRLIPPREARFASSPSTPASIRLNMAAPPAASSLPSPRAEPTRLHGQAYFWDRESNWNAFNDYTTDRQSECRHEHLRSDTHQA